METTSDMEATSDFAERMPVLMGVVNASHDSFSGNLVSPSTVVDATSSMLDEGASIIDIGGQSLRTDQQEIPLEEELARVKPVVLELVRNFPHVRLSLDTYRYDVAAWGVENGVRILNVIHGDPDDRVLALVADSGVSVVLTYNIAAPKVRLPRERLVQGDICALAVEGLERLVGRAVEAGCSLDQLIVDPGPDLGKSPAQTAALIQGLGRDPELFLRPGLRQLLALSRKDFLGALAGRKPKDRSAGLLAALSVLDLDSRTILRVHRPAEVRDFYLVKETLRGRIAIDPELNLPVRLRYDHSEN